MRPKSTSFDLPSTYDVKVHLHNQFVLYMKSLKEEIKVIKFYLIFGQDLLTMYWGRRLQERFQLRRMAGQQIIRKWDSKA
jgi:hypothetical protein